MSQPSHEGKYVSFTIGAVSYSFELAAPVRILPRPARGRIIATEGTLSSVTRLNAPWVILGFNGLGLERALVSSDDMRYWDATNIDTRWPGYFCLGPLAQTATDVAGTRRVTGFAEGIGKLFAYSPSTTAALETVLYWVGSTQTWTDCTLRADAGADTPVRGMAEHDDSGTVRMYALRYQGRTSGINQYQLYSTTDGTTWTQIDHVNAADLPGGAAGRDCYGLVDLNGTLYTVSYTGSTAQLRSNASNGVTWTSPAGGQFSTSYAPQSLRVFPDAGGVPRVFIGCREAIRYYNGSAVLTAVEFGGKRTNVNTAATMIAWRPQGHAITYLCVPHASHVDLCFWASTTASAMSTIPTAPGWGEGGLPTPRQGNITAIAASPQFLYVGIGGEDASHNAAIYALDKNLRWHHVAHLGTGNYQYRALFASDSDDAVDRLHVAQDNATPGDVDMIVFENVESSPRTVSGYKHAASGLICTPLNSRGLPDMNGIHLNILMTGSNLSANNKVSAVYASGDASSLAAHNSWGASLGAITATGGSVNFAATPAGSGQAAKQMQLRVDLAGTSNGSPMVESIIVDVRKRPTPKFLRYFTLDMTTRPGTVRGLSSQANLDDVESILSSTTYSDVTYGEIQDKIMTPFLDTDYLAYLDRIMRAGTGQQQTEIQTLLLVMEDV